MWLIIPIVVESIFSTSLGMFDSMMVSNWINDNAGNAVGNVDDINNLIIQLFSAFATGGVIITSQYLGAKKIEEANKSAKHVVVIVFIASMAICILSLIFNYPLLKLFFGGVSDEVFEYQRQYFYITAASFPFIGLFNVCAALLRAQRKSMVTMTSAGLSLVVNLILNTVFMYVLDWGVMGAAAATLISRIVPSVYVMFLITRKRFLVHINIFEKFRFDWKMVKHILVIAIPSGIESCLFQLGKVMTSTFVNASCYTTALADGSTVNFEANANTMAKSLNNLASVVGSGVNNSCLTVVGQSIGTGDLAQTKYYIKKMFLISFIANACAVGFIMGISNAVVYNMYGYSDTAKEIAMNCLYLCLSFQFVTYPLSFTSPAVLKATSDVRYVMFCAVGSMIIVRVGLCWVLTSELFGLQLGAFGYWIAMCADWCMRSILFMSRLFTGRWKKASGLIPEDVADRIKGVAKQLLHKGKKLTYTPYSRKGKHTIKVK
ncbi:MAG: polysaccharide biosynthesis C-terminal domain-containing protein [Clostridia bacterium]|nr:polysaccharide biosynthesis C-terminal domain-containing protein [Clostridia bacterium]